MSVLGFELLDRHVVEGRADAIALAMPEMRLRYAELLERVAALAGALAHLGVEWDDNVAIDASDPHHEVLAVLACIRLGALPGDEGEIRIETAEGRTVVRTPTETHEWGTVMKMGASDPAATLERDPGRYRERLDSSYDEVISTLISGGSLTRGR